MVRTDMVSLPGHLIGSGSHRCFVVLSFLVFILFGERHHFICFLVLYPLMYCRILLAQLGVSDLYPHASPMAYVGM